MYDPATARPWRRLVAAAVAEELERQAAGLEELHEGEGGEPPPTDRAVAVDLRFRIPRPKTHYSTKAGFLRPSAPSRHLKKPEVDNLAKAVLDELGSVINDDRQIVALTVKKRYIEPGEAAGVSISVWLEPDE